MAAGRAALVDVLGGSGGGTAHTRMASKLMYELVECAAQYANSHANATHFVFCAVCSTLQAPARALLQQVSAASTAPSSRPRQHGLWLLSCWLLLPRWLLLRPLGWCGQWQVPGFIKSRPGARCGVERRLQGGRQSRAARVTAWRTGVEHTSTAKQQRARTVLRTLTCKSSQPL